MLTLNDSRLHLIISVLYFDEHATRQMYTKNTKYFLNKRNMYTKDKLYCIPSVKVQLCLPLGQKRIASPEEIRLYSCFVFLTKTLTNCVFFFSSNI